MSQSELEQKSLEIWIMELYAEGKLSQSKSAHLLGIKVDEFLELFYKKHYKHQGGPLSREEAESDLDAALS